MKQLKNTEVIEKIGIILFFVAWAGAIAQGHLFTNEPTILHAQEPQDTVVEPTGSPSPTPTDECASAKTIYGDSVYFAGSPCSTPKPIEIEYIPTESDILVGKYADKFGRNVGERSRLRGTLHCLLNRESHHDHNKGHGDNGKAGGPLQFWEDTYKGYRKLMISEGLVEEVGSRYNLDNAIETTTWALTTGRGKAWGPILRGECLDLH